MIGRPEKWEGLVVERTFQVDLRGIVDLLSRHLYTGPPVYVRELLQNAVDAIAARRLIEPDAPAAVHVVAGEVLEVHDSGIGLTEDEVHELLATIGRSSKRDDFGFARQEFLGQFGIGLLSCFLVADKVRVTTRSVKGGPTIVWTGFTDGHYTVTPADSERDQPGTTVTLAPRRGMAHWLDAPVVTDLATAFGGLLPVPVTVNGLPVNENELPWQRQYASPHDRTAALRAYGESLFGFTPFDTIDLRVPEAGLSGVAFVLPMAVNPTERGGHRVYLRRMLLGANVQDLLPEWAFFVRCVVDTSELRPTANREALYDDDLLAGARDAIGARLRDWLVTLSATHPQRLQQFLEVHHLGVKALAVHDDAMLGVVDRWWPMETNLGPRTLAEFRRTHPTIRYTVTASEFRELAAVAAAQGIGLVNGGYTYDIEIMKRVPELDPAVRVRHLDPADLTTSFAPPDPVTAQRLRPFVALAENLLGEQRCAVLPRTFDPPEVPALYLVSRAAVRAGEMSAARESAGDLWSGVLANVDGPAPGDDRSQLVLNLANPVVRRITELPDANLAGLGVQALYGQALLQGHHPLHAEDSAVLNQALLGLLDWTVRPGEDA